MLDLQGLEALLLGLASAASWGAADFSGGLATKRASVYLVIILSQLVGFVFITAAGLLLSANLPALQDVLLGGIAGISGAIGLVFLYRGLAGGKMGIVAPVSALVTAIIPVIFAFITEGLPATHQLLGFLVALAAIWLITQTGQQEEFRYRDLADPVFAGCFFAVFFIIISRVSENAILWPLSAARAASILVMLALAVSMRARELPQKKHLPLIALTGILDTSGNAFFALATRYGRLDLAAILASLYPASTVLLAYFLLKERLTSQQLVGIVLALAAVIFITM